MTPRDGVDVYCLCAAWCRLCEAYAAVFARVGAELAAAHPGLRWRWVDVEDEAEQLGELDIDTFPTLLVLGPEGLRFAGAIAPQEDTLRRVLRACVEDCGGEAPCTLAQAWAEEAAAAARRLRDPG
jgi:thioredoxin 1